ncbi:MAG TPA: VWA domain-containing protein [Gammaproteobacteria bacterium]|nr:VWA domain-containing protein [Gammaproteobacteria bacterium]
MNIEFYWPWVFILLPLPLLVAWVFPRAPVSTPSALHIPFFEALEPGLASHNQQRSTGWKILALTGWLLLVTAAARPQLIGESIELPISGRSLMMAVDISGSMLTEDMVISHQTVTRLTAVKAVAGDFIERRKGDRLGLILFGSQAYLQTPLTFDRKTLHTLLDEAQMGLAGKQTAIGDAIGLAVKRLREQPRENRVLILLTDGANTAGNVDPLKAADLAAQEGIRIYTIGVGADAQMVRTPFGLTQVGGSDLDEPTLQAIASKTGGEYFRARDVQSLQKIYQIMDKMEPVSKDSLSYRPVDELYQWPLALALFLSVLITLGIRGILPLPKLISGSHHA